MKSYKRLLSFAAAAALTVSTAASWGSASVSAEDSVLYINEVCTGNNGENGNITYAADTSGEYCDWIELYNPSGSDVNLSGWKLIKDGSSEYSFGDVTVAAGEYKIVFCCKNMPATAATRMQGIIFPETALLLRLTTEQRI